MLPLTLSTALACRDRAQPEVTSSPAPGSVLVRPDAGMPPPPPRKGMVWIHPGALVAGTAPDQLPRIADEEMPGEQVIMTGFFIDVFPYPNEEGAIPHTSVSREGAAALCAEIGKRLCTELEWERACKGPKNTTYEYGNRYRPEICGTGAKPALLPSGLRFSCASEFGVHDMHGGVWEWTSSDWGRDSKRELATARGGNAPAGELAGRCANGMGRSPDEVSGIAGFRCCVGPVNEQEVNLHVKRGRRLERKEPIDRDLGRSLESLLPEQAKQELPKSHDFKIDRMWFWRPIGNEELVVAGGCAGVGKQPACGILIARVVLDRPKILAWVSSGHWAATMHTDRDARDLWLFAGDDMGSFRRLVGYVWGRVSVGPKERRFLPPKRTTRKKNKR